MNRTGIGSHPVDGKRMVEGSEGFSPSTLPDGIVTRRRYIEDSEEIGSIPPPTSVKGVLKATKDAIIQGARPSVFIDKLAERLAFERTGVRLYEAVITKFETLGSFEGGPTAAELKHFHDQELAHFALLKECIEEMGADPTAVTPSADLAGVESMGVGVVLGDPRTKLAQCLHALLVAELVDRDGWGLLIDLADHVGHTEMADRFRAAERDEEQHLAAVRRWVKAHAVASVTR